MKREAGSESQALDATLRLILAQMPAVVWATDTNLRFTLSEGGGLVKLGAGPGEAVGSDLYEYFRTDDTGYPPIAAHLRALAGDPQTYELDWAGRTLLSHLEPLRAGGTSVSGVVGVAIDITERKQMERELSTTIESLRTSDQSRRQVLARLANAQEEERRRIASDVHDGPVQKLAAIGLRLQMLHRATKDPGTSEALTEIERIVDATNRELRTFLLQLVPPALEQGELVAPLRAMLADFEESTGVRTHLDSRLDVEPESPISMVCFRIVQEAVTNIRKHAFASEATITLGNSDEGLLLRIRDDGQGFDPASLDESAQPGQTAMLERAELAGGWCRIDSEPGQGTSIECWLPLHA